jgi:hypothetical protein
MKTNSSYMTKTYPPSVLESLAQEPNEYNTKEALDRLIASKPSPQDLESHIMDGMNDIRNTTREVIYIVAGTYEEFLVYKERKAEEFRKKPPEKKGIFKMPIYSYVKNRYDLMGLNDVKGYYIGTAFQRKDITQIKEAIAYVKSKKPLERAKPLKTSMTAVPITNEDMENLYEK